MKTKSVLFASLAALSVSLFVPIVSAKESKSETRYRASNAGERIESMKAELDLTDAQVEKLRPIFKSQAEAMQAFRRDDSLSKDEKQAKVKALRETNRDAIGAILTPEQKAKLRELRESRGAKNGDRKAKASKAGDRKGKGPKDGNRAGSRKGPATPSDGV